MDTKMEERIAETMRLLGDPHGCGWVNCTKQFNGDSPPPGWMKLILCKYQRQRELILCPTHGSELERELKAEQNA
jgi:hypothetical protein